MTLHCPHCNKDFRPKIEPLTKKQFEIFVYIEAYMRANGVAPTFAEIAVEFGLTSQATVHEHIKQLERRGVLGRGIGPRNLVLHVRSDEIGETPAPSYDNASFDDGDEELMP